MNLRTLKKRCQRAKAVLIAEHQYHEKDFGLAEGDEAICAPAGLEDHFVERYGGGSAWVRRLLPGTPLLWRRTSYECDEWDSELPSETLLDIIAAQNTNWAKMAREARHD